MKPFHVVVGLLLLSVVAGTAVWFLSIRRQASPLRMEPPPEAAWLEAKETTPSCAASGWSSAKEEAQAVREAVSMARRRLGNKKEVFAFVVPTPAYDAEKIREELDHFLAPGAKVHGISSGAGVMTEEGYCDSPGGALAVLLLSEDCGIHFGVGAAEPKEFPDEAVLGETAMRRAIQDAGKGESSRLKMVWYAGVLRAGREKHILEGIARVAGRDMPVLGGNNGIKPPDAAGPFTREKMYPGGLVLTAVYTDRAVGWGFEYGFRQTDTIGTVTRASPAGDVIHEINGRPALDVYDEWLNGKLLPLVERESVETIVGYTSCHPFGLTLREKGKYLGQVVVVAIPTKENLKDRFLPVFVSVPAESEIRLLSGRWQNLLNRADQAISMALLRGRNRPDNVEFGLLYFCWAASRAIPPPELPKFPLLVRNRIPGVPFVGLFSRGEQGPLPGEGNLYCNLATTAVLVERDKAAASSGKDSPREP